LCYQTRNLRFLIHSFLFSAALLALCQQCSGDVRTDSGGRGHSRQCFGSARVAANFPAEVAAKTGRTQPSLYCHTEHPFLQVWSRKQLLQKLWLRGGGVGETTTSEDSLEEIEPDWLVDMKKKQARGEEQSLEEDSSWNKPDILDKIQAGRKADVERLDFDEALKLHRKPLDGTGGGNAERRGYDDSSTANKGSDLDGSEDVVEEDAAYMEHNGQRMPLVGNAGKDVEFLRKLSHAWKVQGHSMKVVVPPHLQAELEKPVSACKSPYSSS